jgi:cell division protein FtsQ
MTNMINALEIPDDIKLVNWLSSALLFFFILLAALSGFQYLSKNTIKNLDEITIKGDINYSDVASIRSNIISNIVGNFYNMDLNKTKQIFESISWINQAVVKRVYPSKIEVRLTEYKPKAIWGVREDMKLVDDSGAIFDANANANANANAEEEEFDLMPQLIGPEGQGKLMLDMYRVVAMALEPLKNKLKILELNTRGSWIATLEGGAHIELGRGSAADVVNRANKFSAGAELMLAKLNKRVIDIQYVDLRHAEGYALRMHGVSTLDLTVANKSSKK